MGIGTLRRYHKPVEQEAAPEVEPGPTPTPEEAEAAALANAAKIQAEQEAQAAAANAHPNGQADGTGVEGQAAESVNPAIQEQGGEEAGDEHAQIPVAEQPSPTPGDVSVVTEGEIVVGEPVHLADEAAAQAAANERAEAAGAAGLNRGSSTALWQAFAAERIKGGESLPFNPAEANRDAIASWYLGEK